MLSDNERLALLEVARRYRPLPRHDAEPIGVAMIVLVVVIGIGLVLSFWLLCVVLLALG